MRWVCGATGHPAIWSVCGSVIDLSRDTPRVGESNALLSHRLSPVTGEPKNAEVSIWHRFEMPRLTVIIISQLLILFFKGHNGDRYTKQKQPQKHT